MKQTLLFLITVMASFMEVQAQSDYRPMIADGKSWLYDGWYYTLSGDTVINGNPYKKMFRKDIWDKVSSYEGAWREEDRKVYRIIAGNTLPVLMYDFTNNTVGSLFEGMRLECVDTVKVERSGMVARYVWSCTDGSGALQRFYWAEGFGGSQGILYPTWESLSERRTDDGDFLYCLDTSMPTWYPLFRAENFYDYAYVEENIKKADEISVPVVPDAKTFVTSFSADTELLLLNVLTEGYVTHGEAWGLQATASELSPEEASVYRFSGKNLSEGRYSLWSKYDGSHEGCLVRSSNDAMTGPVKTCFVNGKESDVALGKTDWVMELKDAEKLIYRIKLPQDNSSYTEGNALGISPSHYSLYMENTPGGNGQTYALYWDVPEESTGAEWQFVDVSAYRDACDRYPLLCTLYHALWKAVSGGLDVEEELEVYRDASATAEDLEAAHESVAQKTKATNVRSVSMDTKNSGAMYDLQGRRVKNPKPGIYIISGSQGNKKSGKVVVVK